MKPRVHNSECVQLSYGFYTSPTLPPMIRQVSSERICYLSCKEVGFCYRVHMANVHLVPRMDRFMLIVIVVNPNKYKLNCWSSCTRTIPKLYTQMSPHAGTAQNNTLLLQQCCQTRQLHSISVPSITAQY